MVPRFTSGKLPPHLLLMLSDYLTYSDNTPWCVRPSQVDRSKIAQGRPTNDIDPYGNEPRPALAPYRGKYNSHFCQRKNFAEHIAKASKMKWSGKFPKECLNVDTFEYGDIAFTFDDAWAFAERHHLTIHCEREDSQSIFSELKGLGVRASILTPCTVVADFSAPIVLDDEPLGDVFFIPSVEEIRLMKKVEKDMIEDEHKRIEREFDKQLKWYEEIKKQRSRKRRKRRNAV